MNGWHIGVQEPNDDMIYYLRQSCHTLSDVSIVVDLLAAHTWDTVQKRAKSPVAQVQEWRNFQEFMTLLGYGLLPRNQEEFSDAYLSELQCAAEIDWEIFLGGDYMPLRDYLEQALIRRCLSQRRLLSTVDALEVVKEVSDRAQESFFPRSEESLLAVKAQVLLVFGSSCLEPRPLVEPCSYVSNNRRTDLEPLIDFLPLAYATMEMASHAGRDADQKNLCYRPAWVQTFVLHPAVEAGGWRCRLNFE